MTDEYVAVASFPKTYNLSALLVHFTENGVNYRLDESETQQTLLVAEREAANVARFLHSLNAGELPQQPLTSGGWWRVLQRWPVTLALIALGIVGYLLTRFDLTYDVVRYVSFVDYRWVNRMIVPVSFTESVVSQGQWWRLVTPTFLHFGLLHILFNGLGVWELGRRLEFYLGWKAYLAIFITLAVLANALEYWVNPGALFGGLSGALFGFIGLLGVLNWRASVPILKLPKGLYVMGIVWALAGATGLVNALFGIQLANGAHFGGLICGAIIGGLLPIKRREINE